jgi:hypothetical protein
MQDELIYIQGAGKMEKSAPVPSLSMINDNNSYHMSGFLPFVLGSERDRTPMIGTIGPPSIAIAGRFKFQRPAGACFFD